MNKDIKEYTELVERLEPLGSNILFRFLDEINSNGSSKREFTSRATESGIILSSIQDEQKAPRWGQVIVAGPDSGVEHGEFVLIQGLMWTNGTTFAGCELWKTDSEQVLIVSNDVKDTFSSTF